MATLNIQIAASADDAKQTTTTVVIDGTTLDNDLDTAGDWAGMRYIVPDIVSGDTIDVAYLTLNITGTGSDEPNVNIYCQAADNPGTFTTGASDISNRTRTTGVLWSSADLGATANTDHNTASLVTPVQEVVNRAGWAAGNAMVFIINGITTDGTRDLVFNLFDGAGGAAVAPRLHIEYTAAGGGGATAFPKRQLLLGVG